MTTIAKPGRAIHLLKIKSKNQKQRKQVKKYSFNFESIITASTAADFQILKTQALEPTCYQHENREETMQIDLSKEEEAKDAGRKRRSGSLE